MGEAMRRWERDLRRIDGVVSLEISGGNHIKLKLTNGRMVFCSSSPSDIYALKNATRVVSKELRWGISENQSSDVR
jgi:hypothetical protein